MISLPTRLLILVSVLLIAVGWDDLRRSRSSGPAAPALVASAHADVAPRVVEHETERVVTQLRCSDGTTITQTDARAETQSAAAPVTATATAAVAQPAGATPADVYRYSLRVDSNPSRPRDIGVSVSARLGNLPIQVVVGGQMDAGVPAVRAGLQLDF